MKKLYKNILLATAIAVVSLSALLLSMAAVRKAQLRARINDACDELEGELLVNSGDPIAVKNRGNGTFFIEGLGEFQRNYCWETESMDRVRDPGETLFYADLVVAFCYREGDELSPVEQGELLALAALVENPHAAGLDAEQLMTATRAIDQRVRGHLEAT